MSKQRADVNEMIDRISRDSPSLTSPEDGGLALVAREQDFSDRYRVWRGRSGKRYLVTVMPFAEAMRVENGVVLLVAIQPDGARDVVWAGFSGDVLPGLVLAPGAQLEAHVHLLAASSARRKQALDDLASGTQGYSSVLAVRAAASQDSVGSTTPSRSSSRAVFTT